MSAKLILPILLLTIITSTRVQSQCSPECPALASYYVLPNMNLTYISTLFFTSIDGIVSYNPQITNGDFIDADSRVNVPFQCGCVNGIQAHQFVYDVDTGDTYTSIASITYVNLTSVQMMMGFNNYDENNVPDTGRVNVTVNCSCGDRRVSRDYGLFVTYPLRHGDSLSSIANDSGVTEELLMAYNSNSDFNSGRGLVFVPGRDQNRTYPPLSSSSSAGISSGVIAGIFVAVAVAVIVAVILRRVYFLAAVILRRVCFYVYCRRLMRVTPVSLPLGTYNNSNSHNYGITEDKLVKYSYDELAKATDNFSVANKIGQGGFGAVYYGKLRREGNLPTGIEIAVKRLSRSSRQGLEECMNEVVLISKLQHRNLVKLLGFCLEGDENMLVYEYIPKGSLDAFLFDPLKHGLLDWSKRVNIIIGIGRGLLYLHRDSRLRVIHRDLKASNILLDEELKPKISDFGIAKIFGDNQDHANTSRIFGTLGYMSPEYVIGGRFSERSDVFSFGVLLLEIVSGRRNTSFNDEEHDLSLLGFVWKLWNEEKTLEFIDQMIYDPCLEIEMLRYIHVGLLCVQDFARDRPTMPVVLSMLRSEIAKLPTPKQPAFTERQTSSETNCLPQYSVNDVTITILQGR